MSKLRPALLLLIPAAPLMEYILHMQPVWVFAVGLAAIAVVADWIRMATDQLARHTGPAVGGLLSVSLGSLAEMLLAAFVLADGQAEVVRAQITGSIIGTSLLGLGVSIVAGGMMHEHQTFKRERASLLASLLILSVIALILPAVFDYTHRQMTNQAPAGWSDEELSLTVSAVLLLLYGGNLVYTLVTHRGVFSSDEEETEPPSWSVWKSLGVLAATTACAAGESELVSNVLNDTVTALGVSPVFMGVIVLGLVGTIADVFGAVWFATQDRLGMVMSLCIGSAVQVALVVAPILVILSWLIGHPMTLVFHNPLDLLAITAATFIVNAIAGDGETTWFEGVMLIGVYILFGLAYYFV